MAEHTHQAARAQAQGKATNFLICFIATGHLSVQSVQSVVKEEQPEDMNPSHPSHLYDSWLKWGKREVRGGKWMGSDVLPHGEPIGGLEPPTHALRMRCSTN